MKKKNTNPYNDKPFRDAHLFVRPRVLPILLFQSSLLLLGAGWILEGLLGGLIFIALFFLLGDELKMASFDIEFKSLILKVYLVCGLMSFLSGVLGLLFYVFPLMVVSVVWAVIVFRYYKRIHPLSGSKITNKTLDTK